MEQRSDAMVSVASIEGEDGIAVTIPENSP